VEQGKESTVEGTGQGAKPRTANEKVKGLSGRVEDGTGANGLLGARKTGGRGRAARIRGANQGRGLGKSR